MAYVHPAGYHLAFDWCCSRQNLFPLNLLGIVFSENPHLPIYGSIKRMSLSKKQLKFLRAKCHDLKAVIMLGQKGLTAEVLNELDIALDSHELVKIKLAVDDRELRKQVALEICEKSQSEVVQAIGKTLSVYRVNPDKAVIELPSG